MTSIRIVWMDAWVVTHVHGACRAAFEYLNCKCIVLSCMQVDVLTGLNLQLAERMEALQGDVQSALQDMAKRVLAGVRHHGDMHQQALQGTCIWPTVVVRHVALFRLCWLRADRMACCKNAHTLSELCACPYAPYAATCTSHFRHCMHKSTPPPAVLGMMCITD